MKNIIIGILLLTNIIFSGTVVTNFNTIRTYKECVIICNKVINEQKVTIKLQDTMIDKYKQAYKENQNYIKQLIKIIEEYKETIKDYEDTMEAMIEASII